MDDTNTRKCAHSGCNCTVKEGEKYCSPSCHDSRDTMDIMCNCGHAACTGFTPTR